MCSNFPIRLFLFKNFTPGQWKCIIQSGDYIFTLTIPRERGSEQSNADQEGGDRYKFTRKYSVWGILLRKLHGMSPFAVKMCFTPTTTTEFLECVYTYIYMSTSYSTDNVLLNRQWVCLLGRNILHVGLNVTVAHGTRIIHMHLQRWNYFSVSQLPSESEMLVPSI